MYTLVEGIEFKEGSWIDGFHEKITSQIESQAETLKEHWKRVMLVEMRKRKQLFISLGVNPSMQFCGDIKGLFRNTFIDAMVEIFEEKKI